ncbi:MAG TPA: hypothetical protein VFT79_00255 [Solirubrobacterales bacterium]|nr:hypothetical protein [Solirubrobacterales bacterium]
MNKLILTTLGLVIAVAFALGCGGGEDEATSADEAASPPLTKAQFIKQADAICAQISEDRTGELNRWKKQNPEKASTEREELDAGFKDVIGASVAREAEQLEALVPPEADEIEVSQMLATLSKVSEELEQEGVKTLDRPHLRQFKTEAAEYGLEVCRFP